MRIVRGVVASPGIVRKVPGGVVYERSVSAREVRYYVLYWDRVIIPGNNLWHVGIPEEDEFISSGAVERPRVEFRGGVGGEDLGLPLSVSQAVTAQRLAREDPSAVWSIHQIGQSVALPDEYLRDANVIRVSLSRMLPVPDAHTPVEDILEFRGSRRDELGCLHRALDETCGAVVSDPARPLSEHEAVQDLKAAIHDLQSVSGERWTGMSSFDFSFEFSLDGARLAPAVTSGAVLDILSGGTSFPIATIGGGLLSLLSIKASAGKTFQKEKGGTDLAYLVAAAESGIVGRDSAS